MHLALSWRSRGVYEWWCERKRQNDLASTGISCLALCKNARWCWWFKKSVKIFVGKVIATYLDSHNQEITMSSLTIAKRLDLHTTNLSLRIFYQKQKSIISFCLILIRWSRTLIIVSKWFGWVLRLRYIDIRSNKFFITMNLKTFNLENSHWICWVEERAQISIRLGRFKTESRPKVTMLSKFVSFRKSSADSKLSPVDQTLLLLWIRFLSSKF